MVSPRGIVSERSAMKVACCVLGGERASDRPDLLDLRLVIACVTEPPQLVLASAKTKYAGIKVSHSLDKEFTQSKPGTLHIQDPDWS